MPIGYIFWGLMIVALIFGPGYGFIGTPPLNQRIISGGNLLLFVLLAILGYHAFGSAVK